VAASHRPHEGGRPFPVSRPAQRDPPLPAETLAELPALDGGGAAWDEREGRALQVSRLLRTLPDGYAELLEEKYLEGFSVRDMAARRGQSEKAVESAHGRARETFRDAWRRTHGRNVEDLFATPGASS
jgi:DNA-directed RNA polymerase specialized sigma24 family protein